MVVPFGREALEALMERREFPSLSLYMPTHRAGPDVRQNPVRFRNLLRQVEERLAGRGLRPAAVEAVLEPARAMPDEDPFWQHQQAGLALFLAPGFSRWQVLPLPVEERVVVGDRFHLKPLLPLLSGDGRFYLLALSQNSVRLFEGTRHQVAEVDLERVPKSLAEALPYDDPEEQLQYFGRTRTGTGVVFHGHGVGRDDAKDRILRYFQQVNRGIRTVLRNAHAPLVLAGVEYELSIYRAVNTYPHLLREAVTGNPDDLRAAELHDRAWRIAGAHFRDRQDAAATTYRQLAGTGLSSHDVRELLPAAAHGRVDRLFVATDRSIWGRFDPLTAEVTIDDDAEPGADDLLDLAAVHTILAAGVVFAVPHADMPERSAAAAIFRY